MYCAAAVHMQQPQAHMQISDEGLVRWGLASLGVLGCTALARHIHGENIDDVS